MANTEYNKAYYKANKAQLLARQKRWYEENKERILAAQKTPEARKRAAENRRKCPTLKMRVRRYWLKSAYGMTQNDWADMFGRQGNACAVCGKTDTKRWAVDHDHKTGKVRAVLCLRCNILLGHAKENMQTLQSAIDYLLRHA